MVSVKMPEYSSYIIRYMVGGDWPVIRNVIGRPRNRPQALVFMFFVLLYVFRNLHCLLKAGRLGDSAEG